MLFDQPVVRGIGIARYREEETFCHRDMFHLDPDQQKVKAGGTTSAPLVLQRRRGV